jgi:hypothetical protein
VNSRHAKQDIAGIIAAVAGIEDVAVIVRESDPVRRDTSIYFERSGILDTPLSRGMTI